MVEDERYTSGPLLSIGKNMESSKKPRISLLDRTRELLRNRPSPVKLSEVAEKCGCSTSCLSHLLAGETKDPSVNLVQTLYETLTGTELNY